VSAEHGIRFLPSVAALVLQGLGQHRLLTARQVQVLHLPDVSLRYTQRVLAELQGSPRLSAPAASALTEAQATDGVVVSVATLIDLWYVTQTTKKLTASDLGRLRASLISSPGLITQTIDLAVVEATIAIPRDLLTDPWDRFIVASARTWAVPLVTKDRAIRDSRLVPTVW